MGGGGGSLRQLWGGDSLTTLRPPHHRWSPCCCRAHSLVSPWMGPWAGSSTHPSPWASSAFMAEKVWPALVCVVSSLALPAV